jgi:peptide/nickel transport system substrate-binding protein
MISIPDNQARLNALLGGQIDAMENLEFPAAKAQASNDAIKILSAPGLNPVPMVMSLTRPPFTDPKVSQALRLCADRPALVANALLGFGTVGNDIFGADGFADYNTDLPQREYDPEQAKSLLKAAGKEGLNVTLTTSKAAPGMLESATIFAQQAAAAGVKVTLDQTPADTYYTDKYLKVPFFYTQWNTLPVEFFMLSTYLSTSPYNETGWKHPEWDQKFNEARGTLDKAKRQELFFSCQKDVWDAGGYLIWGYNNWVDAVAKNVNGIEPSDVLALDGYNFTKAWLA